MGYYIDLVSISIDDYKIKLESGYLPPSRLILKDRTEERFGYFKRIGIKNVKELLQFLKKKENSARLVEEDCFSGAYLTILLRELNSMLPKPNRIKDFTGISEDTILKLEKSGIKDTLKLYDRVKSPESRKELAMQTGISEAELQGHRVSGFSFADLRFRVSEFQACLTDQCNAEIELLDTVSKDAMLASQPTLSIYSFASMI